MSALRTTVVAAVVAAVVATAALLLALGAAFWLALDRLPLVTAPPVVASGDVERARNLFKRHDPQHQRPGIVRLLAADQREVNLALGHLAGRWAGLAAQVTLEQGAATVRASVPVPYTSRWANVDARLVQSQGLPEIGRLRIGKLPLPAWCAQPLIAWALQRRGLSADPQLARDVVRHVDLRAGRLLVFYAWQEDTSSRMLTALVPPAHQERLKAYSDRLVELISSEPTGAAIPLARLLPPLFAQARQRVAAGADAVQENRAAILALTFYANRQGLSAIVPAARHWKSALPRTVTLGGRSDLPLHFLVSATIAAESGGPLANAVGLYKEVADSQGGSGFSFIDLAADRAGTRFGQRAVRDASWLQSRLAEGVIEGDLLPDVSDLPEYLSATQFQQRFGALGSAPYRRLMDHIETRLDALDVLR